MNHMMLPTTGKLIACEFIWFDLASPYEHTNVSDCLVGRQIKIILFTADRHARHTVEVRIRKVTRRDVLVQAKLLQSEALRGRHACSPARGEQAAARRCQRWRRAIRAQSHALH